MLERSAIRARMNEKVKEVIPESLLVQFTFTSEYENKYVQWEKEGKEFKYKGDMYDIVRMSGHRNSVTYTCLRDKDEKKLIADFQNLLKKNLENEGKTKNNQPNELSKYNFSVSTIVQPEYKLAEFSITDPDFYKSLNIEIISPPPKPALI